MTRVLVVDDSSFMRTIISDQLQDRGVEVVGTARTGREAVDMVGDLGPDVVTMDVEMPEMNGIEAVESIMDRNPTPIVMLSAHTDEDADATFEALDRGAVDFMPKPGGEVSVEIAAVIDELLEKIQAAADVEVATRRAVPELSQPSHGAGGADATIVIGASTGGPRVIEELIGALPEDTRSKILVVQHMPPEFTAQFAQRLDAAGAYSVEEARDGTVIGAGDAAVAPGDTHLRVAATTPEGLRLAVDDDPPVNSVRPAIDVTMRSAAETVDGPLIGVLLTGLGRDGTEGAGAIQRAGGTVIAQDEGTAQVFGIPGRAIESGNVDDVCRIDEVPRAIVDAVE